MTNNTKDFDNDRTGRDITDPTSPSAHLVPTFVMPSMAPRNHRSSATLPEGTANSGSIATIESILRNDREDNGGQSLFSVSLMPSMLSVDEANTITKLTNQDIVNILDEVMDIIAEIDDAEEANENSNKHEDKDNWKKDD